MEQEALDVIDSSGDKLHYYVIAQELKVSAHYAYVICKGLERKGYVGFDAFKGICSLTGKGKDKTEENWLSKLKSYKEDRQRKRKINKKRLLTNIETINY